MFEHTKSEELFLQFLQNHNIEYLDISKIPFWFKSGIDFWIKINNKYYAIEIKEDSLIHKTGNVFVEYLDNNGTKGCMARSNSHYIFYYDLYNKIFYIINSKKLKQYIATNKLPYKKGREGSVGYLPKLRDLLKLGIAKELNI